MSSPPLPIITPGLAVLIETSILLRKEIKKLVGEDVYVNIVEVKNPDLNAKLVAQSIASQIELEDHIHRNVILCFL